MSTFCPSQFFPGGGIAYNFPVTYSKISLEYSSTSATTYISGNYSFAPFSFWKKNKDNFLRYYFSYRVSNAYGSNPWETNSLMHQEFAYKIDYSKIDSSTAFVSELITFTGFGRSDYYNNQSNKYYMTGDTGITSQIYIKREDGSFVTS